MSTELFSDNAATTLASSPAIGATTFTVTSSSAFPAAVTGVSQFRVIIDTEIVTVTNVTGTTWTCEALAVAHTAAVPVTHVITAAGLGNHVDTKVAAEAVIARAAEGLLAPIASPAFTGTPTGITKTHVGLGSVDNTADSAKPVSTAQAAADTAAIATAAADATAKVTAARVVPRWAPTTAYTLGQQVVSPGNDVVSAIAGHTSGSTFTPANWTLSSTYARVGETTVDASLYASINAAIAALPSHGGKVMLTAAQYTENVVINKNNVTLEGVGFGFWDSFVGGNPGTGTEGTGLSKIKSADGTSNIISIAAASGRLSGITLQNLYLYGNGTTGAGIYGAAAGGMTDQLNIDHCFVHKTAIGMNIYADSFHVTHNTVMDVSGIGIQVSANSYGFVQDNVVADITGDGIVVASGGSTPPQISGNTVVRTARGIYLLSPALVANNVVQQARGIGIELNASGIVVNGNVVRSGSSEGIKADSGASRSGITNNSVVSNASYGIHNMGSTIQIDGNLVDSNLGKSIFVEANDGMVTNNMVLVSSLTENGIEVNALSTIVTSNRILSVTGANTGYGILIPSTKTYIVVANNIVISAGTFATKYSLPVASATVVNTGNI